MKPRHFHLVAAGVITGVAIFALVSGKLAGAVFLLAGAFVALLYWKTSGGVSE